MRYRVAISLFSILIGLLLVNLLPAPSLIAAGTILNPNGYQGAAVQVYPHCANADGREASEQALVQ